MQKLSLINVVQVMGAFFSLADHRVLSRFPLRLISE